MSVEVIGYFEKLKGTRNKVTREDQTYRSFVSRGFVRNFISHGTVLSVLLTVWTSLQTTEKRHVYTIQPSVQPFCVNKLVSQVGPYLTYEGCIQKQRTRRQNVYFVHCNLKQSTLSSGP